MGETGAVATFETGCSLWRKSRLPKWRLQAKAYH